MTRSQVGNLVLGSVGVVFGLAFIGVGLYLLDSYVSGMGGFILACGYFFIEEARNPVFSLAYPDRNRRACVTIDPELDAAERARRSAMAKKTEDYLKSLRPNRATKATD